jgi:thymidylate kinase
MIIELFGPPCVGKTTLASELTARLRDRGRNVQLVLSYRPAEYPLTSPEGSTRWRTPASLRRLVRPVIESVAAAGRSTDPGEAHAAAELTRLLPPKNLVLSIRLRQYLLRLSRAWRGADLASDVVLFDQGFVQAVCTFALVARAVDPERIALALDVVPEADLVVRLYTPLEILHVRLAERRRCQGKIEQLLDTWTDLRSVWIFDQLYALLQTRGQRVIRVDSADRQSLDDALAKIEAITIGTHSRVPVAPREAAW